MQELVVYVLNELISAHIAYQMHLETFCHGQLLFYLMLATSFCCRINFRSPDCFSPLGQR